MCNHDHPDHTRCGCGGGCRSNRSGERNPEANHGADGPNNHGPRSDQAPDRPGRSAPDSGDLHALNPWDGGVVDRRVFPSRRDASGETGLERRRGAGRRLSDFQKSAEEGEMNKEQFMFLMAIDAFKKGNARQFPTWTDVLEVIRLLGYRKTMGSELCLNNAEDWTEDADAPANVRAARWHQRAAVDKARRDKPAA